MENSPKIVFVFLGSKIPRYAELNLKLIRKTFPDIQIFLISDEPRNGDIVQGVSFHKVPKMHDLWPAIYQNMSHNLAFRNGFWFSSIARFMAIREFMRTGIDGPIIHLELDVLLFPDFPMDLFVTIKEDLAFTLASPSEGSAAVLYIKDLSSINSLVSISEDLFCHSPGSTDMTILRTIFEKKLMSTLILPSVPGEVSDDEGRWNNYVFDPSSWGMYLLGQDPRNHQGRLIFNRSESHHFIQPSEFTFRFHYSKLSVTKGSHTAQLVNLHIHSKDLRVFRFPEKYIRYRTSKASQHEYSRIVFLVFIQLLSKKVKKELGRFLLKLVVKK